MFLQGYGIRYVRGCWGVGGGYERQGVDNRFIFTLELLGLGGMGNQSQFFGRPQFGEVSPGISACRDLDADTLASFSPLKTNTGLTSHPHACIIRCFRLILSDSGVLTDENAKRKVRTAKAQMDNR